MKKLVLVLLLSQTFSTYAQDVNGYWYGSGNVANGASANNYLVEMLLSQNGTAVSGVVNYYFKNTFRSFKINGNFNSQSRQLSIFNIPVTYFGSPINMEVDCPMDIFAQLRVSQIGSNLKGSFVGREGYKRTCPEIFFDFSLNKDAGNKDSVLTALRNYKETHQVWSPSGSDTAIAAVIQQRPVVNYVIVDEFRKRENVIAEEIQVDADSVSVDFYDNGEVDGDSISVFFNNQLLTFNRLLSTKAMHFRLGLDQTKELNEVAMFANNLGSLPPNTALMVVSDGKKRYEVRLSSSLDKNAVVRIRRKKN
jgi:hypothetical protein